MSTPRRAPAPSVASRRAVRDDPIARRRVQAADGGEAAWGLNRILSFDALQKCVKA